MRAAASIFGFIPSVWPVVQRELRARARKPRYYWLRVMGGIAAMTIVYSILRNSDSPSAASITAFENLSLLILALIVTTVPAMTSDCLSREKREGTLGLLFLTPLTPAGIVIGKTAAQAILAWSMWLSVLPAMAIPLLLGGLTWENFVIAAVFQFCSVLISLAAGLLASCSSKNRNTALFYAATLICIFVSSILIFILALVAFGRAGYLLTEEGLLATISGGLSEVIDLQTGQLTPDILLTLLLTLCLALGVLFGAIWLAARHIRKTWSDKPASARQKWWTHRFRTALFQNAFRKKMQRSLDRNPIAWLQQYSWKARITKWGLFLLFLVVPGCAMQSRNPDIKVETQLFLLVTFVVVGTVAGINSFRSEKESGALELILITPLSVKQIILGRAIGWWKQFLPAAILFFLLTIAAFHEQNSMYSYSSLGHTQQIVTVSWIAAVVFFCLPFFSVYAALRVKNFLTAVILTWIGLILVLAFAVLTVLTVTFFAPELNQPHQIPLMFCTVLFSIAFVRLTFFLLRHSLSRRIYSF